MCHADIIVFYSLKFNPKLQTQTKRVYYEKGKHPIKKIDKMYLLFKEESRVYKKGRMPSQTRVITRKRLNEIKELLQDKVRDDVNVDEILSEIAKIFNYDPTLSAYDEKRNEIMKAYRNRKKEEGISTYVTSGGKAAYERKKQMSTPSQ